MEPAETAPPEDPPVEVRTFTTAELHAAVSGWEVVEVIVEDRLVEASARYPFPTTPDKPPTFARTGVVVCQRRVSAALADLKALLTTAQSERSAGETLRVRLATELREVRAQLGRAEAGLSKVEAERDKLKEEVQQGKDVRQSLFKVSQQRAAALLRIRMHFGEKSLRKALGKDADEVLGPAST